MPSQLYSAADSTQDLRNWQMTDLDHDSRKAIHAPVSDMSAPNDIWTHVVWFLRAMMLPCSTTEGPAIIKVDVRRHR